MLNLEYRTDTLQIIRCYQCVCIFKLIPGLSLGNVCRTWLRNCQNQWYNARRHLFSHSTNVDDSQLNCWCQSVPRDFYKSLNQFRTTLWGLWGWGRGAEEGSKKCEVLQITVLSTLLVRGWLLHVNVLGKPRWERIYRSPCLFLSKPPAQKRGMA